MKKMICFGLVLILLWYLPGCDRAARSNKENTAGAVDNIFTQPKETVAVSTVTTEPYSFDSLQAGESGFSMRVNNDGDTVIYTGGELCVSYFMNLSGDHVSRDGTGILLFLDGRPQPYRTDNDNTYRYMHMFYPEDSVDTHVNLYFTPVVGRNGDSLEAWACTMVFPYVGARWFGVAGGKTTTAFSSLCRIQYEATPLAQELPQVQERLLSWRVDHTELRSNDISQGWSGEDLLNKADFVLYTNEVSSKESFYLFGYKEDEPLELRFELWGTPLVEWGLVVFVDHQPVSVQACNTILLQGKNGMKTVVNMEVDMSDFNTESQIYAVLVPRNAVTCGTSGYILMKTTSVQFLLETESVEELLDATDNQ